MANNIVSNLQKSTHVLITEPTSLVTDSLRNNIFDSGSHIQIQNAQYTTAEFQSAFAGKAGNNVEIDPGFVNGLGADFHLKTTSPAINAGVKHSVYQTFFDRYGIDISRDIEEVSRPQGPSFDIGAYEFETQSAGVPPLAPTVLTVN